MATKIIAAAFVGLMLIGCTSTPKPTVVTRIDTVEIFKPVFEVPQELKDFPDLQRPDLPTNHLKRGDEANPGHVAKVMIESEAILREYAEALEDQVEAYKKVINDADRAQKALSEKNKSLLKD